MPEQEMPPRGWREWLTPIVYLSNNWLSLIGVLLVTSATVFWLFLLPTTLRGEIDHPYLGILIFMLLPAVFFLGLGLIPLGMYIRRRREQKGHIFPESFARLDLRNVALRRLLWFILVATFANIVIASQLTYSAVNYMDSVTFCGRTCHLVMQPEYTAYHNSPHSRVECVQCHIGPGASWFVKSKLSGTWQVIAATLNTYPRPIPVPVQNLRPARETCEACHWPQRYGGDRLRVIPTYADDQTNTLTKTVLLMHIGGGGGGPGIHGFHVAAGVEVEYAPSDEQRQKIAWVRYRDPSGKTTEYFAPNVKPEDVAKLPKRVMDCIDCHNRPTHTFELPERGLDRTLAAGEIDSSLPFAKKTAIAILKRSYATRDQAAGRSPRHSNASISRTTRPSTLRRRVRSTVPASPYWPSTIGTSFRTCGLPGGPTRTTSVTPISRVVSAATTISTPPRMARGKSRRTAAHATTFWPWTRLLRRSSGTWGCSSRHSRPRFRERGGRAAPPMPGSGAASHPVPESIEYIGRYGASPRHAISGEPG